MITDFANQCSKNVGDLYTKISKKLNAFSKIQLIKDFKILFIFVFFYGLSLNLVLTVFIGLGFDLLTIIGCGFLWYFISNEGPVIFFKYRVGGNK